MLGEVVDIRSGRDYKYLSEGDVPVYGTGGYMLSVNESLSYKEDAIGVQSLSKTAINGDNKMGKFIIPLLTTYLHIIHELENQDTDLIIRSISQLV